MISLHPFTKMYLLLAFSFSILFSPWYLTILFFVVLSFCLVTFYQDFKATGLLYLFLFTHVALFALFSTKEEICMLLKFTLYLGNLMLTGIWAGHLISKKDILFLSQKTGASKQTQATIMLSVSFVKLSINGAALILNGLQTRGFGFKLRSIFHYKSYIYVIVPYIIFIFKSIHNSIVIAELRSKNISEITPSFKVLDYFIIATILLYTLLGSGLLAI